MAKEKILVMTDSASDISVEEEKKYRIKILPFSISIGNEVFISRKDFDNDGFYTMMAQTDELPKTAQINSFDFEEVYKKYFDREYTDIIYVSINKDGSATYDNACVARDTFFEENPEYKERGCKVHIYDGVGYSGMYGYPVVEAARMVQEGRYAIDVNFFLERELPKRRVYFGIYGLKYAAKSGRIPSAAALVGDALGVKPIMKIADNEIVTAAKCRGEKKLMSKLVAMTLDDMEPESEYQIVYGNDESLRDELEEKLTAALGYGPSDYFQIGAAVAANAGPKVVGSIFNVKKELIKK